MIIVDSSCLVSAFSSPSSILLLKPHTNISENSSISDDTGPMVRVSTGPKQLQNFHENLEEGVVRARLNGAFSRKGELFKVRSNWWSYFLVCVQETEKGRIKSMYSEEQR